ncbi:MAG TPA: response regulator transcription factor [Burkholderiaceae bacterium]|jgi:DNA-binding NarL/FixJ family response regulator|nr:response regulator transcription factor [Burkholderiaceae bacterium]
MSKLRAFIVEDSPVIRENLIATLEELTPFEVVGYAEDEPSALRWLQERGKDCDLCIVDIFLRQGSGFAVLRALMDGPNVPRRVVLSNYATPDVRSRCLELGADRVFDKSNQIDALIGYCERLADGGGDTVAGGLGG